MKENEKTLFIIMNIRRHLRRFFVKSIFKVYPEEWENAQLSYSQFGEDVIVSRILTKKKGFYVDVGACHPLNMSNTHLFYLRGWRGINIEGNPRALVEFEKYRPEDTNIHAVISNSQREVVFQLNESFSLSRIIGDNEITIKHDGPEMETIKVKTQLLKDILNENLKQSDIDLMSIDCEGHDLQVLESNDFDNYRPKVLIVEDHSSGDDSDISIFVRNLKYSQICRPFPSRIFISDELKRSIWNL